MLPCNVVVRDAGNDQTEVAAIDPVASMQAIDNPALKEAARMVRSKLEKAVAAISQACWGAERHLGAAPGQTDEDEDRMPSDGLEWDFGSSMMAGAGLIPAPDPRSLGAWDHHSHQVSTKLKREMIRACPFHCSVDKLTRRGL